MLAGHKLEKKILKKTAIPSIFLYTKEDSTVVKSRRERAQKHKRGQEKREDIAKDLVISEVEVVIGREETVEAVDFPPPVETAERSTLSFYSSTTQTPPALLISAKQFMKDPVGMQVFTGLENYDKFQFVLQSLGPAAYK